MRKIAKPSPGARKSTIAILLVVVVAAVAFLSTRGQVPVRSVSANQSLDAPATSIGGRATFPFRTAPGNTSTPVPSGFIPAPGVVPSPSTVFIPTTPPTTSIVIEYPPTVSTLPRPPLASTPDAATCAGPPSTGTTIVIASAKAGFDKRCYTIKANTPTLVVFENRAVNNESKLPLVLTVELSSEKNPSFAKTLGRYAADPKYSDIIHYPDAAITKTPALLDGTPVSAQFPSLSPGYYYLYVPQLDGAVFAVLRAI